MKKGKYRPVGLAALLGGAIGSLAVWWLRRERKTKEAVRAEEGELRPDEAGRRTE